MGNNVVHLDAMTRLDIPVERVLSEALKSDLAEVTVVGFDQDGDFYFASNKASGPEVLWALHVACKRLLEISEDE